MIEPLIWNPLPRAAEWLAQKTGRPMDALTLVDTVIKMGRMGDSAPTIIKMLLPKNTKCASLSMFNEPALLPASDAEIFTRDRLEKLYGPLPNGITYLSESFPDVANLCVNHLIELLLYGEVAISLLTNKSQADGGAVWLMPWGTEHTATMETCGINRADLLALGDMLLTATAQTAPVTDTTPPAPAERVRAINRATQAQWDRIKNDLADRHDQHTEHLHNEWQEKLAPVPPPRVEPLTAPAQTAAPVVFETPKERRARHLAMFEIEERREKRGALQRLADSVGVDHSNLSKEIKKAKAEREEQKRAGTWTSQLIRDGKR